MEYTFDLNETQQNILEKCPEWTELMNVVEFKNTPWADPTGYGDKTVYYNGRSMRQFPQDAQAYLIAQQLMHIQLAHQQRGKGRDSRRWDLACAAAMVSAPPFVALAETSIIKPDNHFTARSESTADAPTVKSLITDLEKPLFAPKNKPSKA